MATLTNSATITGTYGLEALTLTSNTVTTEIVSGLTIVLAVDKEKWISGPLTYTITVTNNTNEEYVSPVIEDILDTSMVTLIENSVKVDGKDKTYTYDDASGKLSISLDTLSTNSTSVITFRVQQKQTKLACFKQFYKHLWNLF